MRVLAGDIGGTKTLLQLADIKPGGYRVLLEKRFNSSAYAGLLPLVEEFMQQAAQQDIFEVERACFGIAGPITGKTAKVTNLPWHVDAEVLAQAVSLKQVRLINDFQAVGYGIEALDPNDFHVLQRGRAEPRGPRVILGAGTGLGEGLLVWQQDHYEVIASEGGHVGFAPEDHLQVDLLCFLQQQFERVSFERVCSGPGLVNIYEFLVSRGESEESQTLRMKMSAGDPAAAITEYALSDKDLLAVRALDLFIDIYGSQAGNLALTCLASGGIYVAGGIAPKIIDKLKQGGFVRAFRNKGRMQHLLDDMPLKVVMNPKIGLIGAAMAASRL